MNRVSVKPELIKWALERSTRDPLKKENIRKKFKELPEWEDGKIQPTLKQLEKFAEAVHVPIGYLFLTEPPDEPIPLLDFRVLEGNILTQPSPELLETIYICEERQEWYKNFAQMSGYPELSFVGSASTDTPPETVAAEIRKVLDFDFERHRKCSNWEKALSEFIQQIEEAGVLVMVNSVVMNNPHRPLDPEEFRGFVLSDSLVPLIFLNGADTKAAQMFTLAHELAHLWLGKSVLSNLAIKPPNKTYRKEEVWCNAVAAEFLVPLSRLKQELSNLPPQELLENNCLSHLVKFFKVSTSVILRRLFDAKQITRDQFDNTYAQEKKRLSELARGKRAKRNQSGDFYKTVLARTSQRFTHALVVSTLQGQTLYRDAFRMLGISKIETFEKLRRKVRG